MYKDLLVTLGRTLLALLLIPLITLWFTSYALSDAQNDRMQELEQRIQQQRDQLSEAEQQEIRDFHAATPLAGLCRNPHPDAAEMRQAYCEPWGYLWQFTWMHHAAWLASVGGVLFLCWLAVLGRLAFAQRRWQYRSFVTGWHTLTAASVAIVLLQGLMIVWLSYWITAIFSGRFIPKLIVLAAGMAGWAAYAVISKMFQKPAQDSRIVGETVSEADAPHLWQRVRDMAQRLKTRAPHHIVAGIDTNFFVTEAPLTVTHPQADTHTLSGRKLYVSIPLLRQLEREEADAVLAHELAHLSGGDARNSALLGPKLDQFSHYMGHLAENFSTRWAILPFFVLYRMIFELALARDSRAREFRADRYAAKLVSPQAISRSLIKVAAYSNYRNAVEQGLFERDQQPEGPLDIAARVAHGLPAWAATAHFQQALTEGHIPHPYDSHPPMQERMQNVGHVVPPEQFAALIVQQVTNSWADDIRTANHIETTLWNAYEEYFAENHEEALAMRYEPANEAERAIVLKYFPEQELPLKKGQILGITYEGITWPQGEMVALWKNVSGWVIDEKSMSFMADKLIIQFHRKDGKKPWFGLIPRVKIKLSGIKANERDYLCTLLNAYWQRDQHMRAWQAQQHNDT